MGRVADSLLGLVVNDAYIRPNVLKWNTFELIQVPFQTRNAILRPVDSAFRFILFNSRLRATPDVFDPFILVFVAPS